MKTTQTRKQKFGVIRRHVCPECGSKCSTVEVEEVHDANRQHISMSEQHRARNDELISSLTAEVDAFLARLKRLKTVHNA